MLPFEPYFPWAVIHPQLFRAPHPAQAKRLPPELSNLEHAELSRRSTLTSMYDQIRIDLVEKDGADGVLVTFSDGTIAGYVAEELLDIRPYRELVQNSPESGPEHAPRTARTKRCAA